MTKYGMKSFAKNEIANSTQKQFKSSVIVVNELGMVVDVLIKDADTDQVITIEKYFNFNLLDADQYLIQIGKIDGKVYWKELDGSAGSNWTQLPA